MQSTDNPAPPAAFSSATFRFPQPEHYKGERDGFKCEVWLTAINRFFKGARIPDDQRTLHAAIFLTGDATLWWDGNTLTDDAPWNDFVQSFRSAFQPAGFLDQVRNMLFDIKMTSTVPDYVARTRKYMFFLCPHDMSPEARTTLEQAATSCSLKGAPDDLRQVLLTFKLNNPTTTIHALCNVAEQFDQIYHYSARSSSTSSSAGLNYTVASTAAAHQSSVAMEIDNLRVEINSLRRAVGYFHRGPRLQPLTPAERTRLIRIGECFKCREEGHHARDCPPKKNGAINNIATEGYIAAGHQQGNAPSDRA